ncbi:hypothetical protein NC653_000531 [Populus alba x Populus x berolinensis]|uniref:Uncharacterized protein n=1 Tax=Populus alba x Populus x berolinensis TaxID=444605 RepID=A0AAD6RJW7_9ROSI|nr:hypothetical protein NC653_000531 [Populus alba x Populus x berolinensis]
MGFSKWIQYKRGDVRFQREKALNGV